MDVVLSNVEAASQQPSVAFRRGRLRLLVELLERGEEGMWIEHLDVEVGTPFAQGVESGDDVGGVGAPAQ